MELIEFAALFADQFDDTEASKINVDTIYQDLDEWSSLTAMGIIAFVKTEMGKTITGKEIRGCDTIEELYNYLQTK